jgi:hypothetical protein
MEREVDHLWPDVPSPDDLEEGPPKRVFEGGSLTYDERASHAEDGVPHRPMKRWLGYRERPLREGERPPASSLEP